MVLRPSPAPTALWVVPVSDLAGVARHVFDDRPDFNERVSAGVAGRGDIVGDRPVEVGGDYNSTPDMRQFRDLLTNGYGDAVEQSRPGLRQ